jgi:hypothetical protein
MLELDIEASVPVPSVFSGSVSAVLCVGAPSVSDSVCAWVSLALSVPVEAPLSGCEVSSLVSSPQPMKIALVSTTKLPNE